jgi:hypothetical protein
MADVPSHVAAAVAALNFRSPNPGALGALSDAEWQDFLPLCDMMHLTIPLRRTCGSHLPKWVRSRIDANIRDNSERFERIKAAYLELADALRNRGVAYLVLKGFSQSPDFVEDPRLRMQSDIDLYCPSESILQARDALSRIGYESDQGLEHQPTDHLPTMSRRSGWEWRGNAFDPEMPVSVDLHFRFWNQPTTRLRPQGIDEFWVRRIDRRVDSVNFPGLSRVDSLGYAALHVFHHLQLGSLIPYHVYELAHFLNTNADNESFWKEWRDLHDDSLRRLQAVCFRLAAIWFGCGLPEEAEREINRLPDTVQRWFHRYSDSPFNSLLHPNKDTLWLHLSMLESAKDKFLVFCESLIPVRVPPTRAIQRWSLRTYPRFVKYAVSRLSYHLRVLPRTLREGVRWSRSTEPAVKTDTK